MFVAMDGADVIHPPNADEGTDYDCSRCGYHAVVREPEPGDKFTPRVFEHKSDGAPDCPGADADRRIEMVSIAADKAGYRWPDADVSANFDDGGNDVIVDFDEPIPRVGDGIVIECIVPDYDRDMDAIASTAHAEGNSVVWLSESNFGGNDVDIRGGGWEVVSPFDESGGAIVKWDAKCLGCGDVHIVSASESHEPNEVVKMAHVSGRLTCGAYSRHTLLSCLDGLAHRA